MFVIGAERTADDGVLILETLCFQLEEDLLDFAGANVDEAEA